MVTASHLPIDRNGFKFFSKRGGFFRKKDIQTLITDATQIVQKMHQNRLEIRPGLVEKVHKTVLSLNIHVSIYL
jgi:phosphomannomutase